MKHLPKRKKAHKVRYLYISNINSPHHPTIGHLKETSSTNDRPCKHVFEYLAWRVSILLIVSYLGNDNRRKYGSFPSSYLIPGPGNSKLQSLCEAWNLGQIVDVAVMLPFKRRLRISAVGEPCRVISFPWCHYPYFLFEKLGRKIGSCWLENMGNAGRVLWVIAAGVCHVTGSSSQSSQHSRRRWDLFASC